MGFSQFRDGNGMMTFGKTIAEVAVVVRENSNVEKLASHLYLSVHALPQED